MNKIDIIQRLLDERHITAKEALVLMEKEKEIVYYPINHYPIYPSWPNYPIYSTPGTYSDTTNVFVTSDN